MTDTDRHYMQRAISLAARGRFTTAPNPNVGCVIVKDDQIIGEGWHQKAGEPHAEVNAINSASESVAGATCYVTLEPCSHYGRTPPCAELLIRSNVARVVCAMPDPNPLVAGRGFRMLEAAGIQVDVGVEAEQAEALNHGFLTAMREKRSFVQVKLACSLDGKTALANGDSQWITGASARQDVQAWRAQAGAILSSAESVLADNASLNVRWDELPAAVQQTLSRHVLAEACTQDHDLSAIQPLRVIIDTQKRLNPHLSSHSSLKLFSIPSPIILVRTSASDDVIFPDHVSEWVVEQTAEGHADISALLGRLYAHHIQRVWVEAGASLSAALLSDTTQALVDELIVYYAPKIIGHAGMPLLKTPSADVMADVPAHRVTDSTHIGEDIRVTFALMHAKPS